MFSSKVKVILLVKLIFCALSSGELLIKTGGPSTDVALKLTSSPEFMPQKRLPNVLTTPEPKPQGSGRIGPVISNLE